MIKREPNSINGKFMGMWYSFPDGRVMYLAHYSGERTKGLSDNAWRIDTSILRQAERRGCHSVGVIHRVGKHRYVYLTNLSDFWNSPDSGSALQNSMSQRTLPRSKFLLNPSNDREQIDSHIRIR